MECIIWPDGEDGNAVRLAYGELQRARAKFSDFKNGHEGHSVIREELDELWDAVKQNNPSHARLEAVQLAAMALRFVVDVRDSSTLKA